MARYTDASCRLCRREGDKLFLKGQRCYSSKCSIARRSFAPGQHGQGRKKVSEYGLQLREKQKTKRFYGILEKQFHSTFERAEHLKGKTGENLLALLELRFDNVVYRMGLGASRAEARQLVTHGHFTVNGKKVDIPSYTTKVGDVIVVRSNRRDIEHFKIVKEGVNRVIPKWITTTAADLTATVNALPQRDDVDLTLQENMIVEFYSR